MTPAGSATIADWKTYSKNCNVGRCGLKYLAPVPTLADVHLFVNFGAIKPTSVTWKIINLCDYTENETITTDTSVIASNGSYYYGIFKNFTGSSYTSFIIMATTDVGNFFSEQYELPTACDSFVKVSVCYPYNYNAEDLNGIYVGTPDMSLPHTGNTDIFYHHDFWVRQGEVIETSNKISFTASAVKNFASKLDRLFEFRPELVPGWYKDYLLSVYFRGDMYINGVHVLVTDLNIDDVDVDVWKPYAILTKEIKGGFGCATTVCSSDACVAVSIATFDFYDASKDVPYYLVVPLGGSLDYVLSDVTKPAWMEINIVGKTIVFSGTPTIGDVGDSLVSFKITNPCGSVTIESKEITVLSVTPEVEVTGTLTNTAKKITVTMSSTVPCDSEFGIYGTYDLAGTPTEFFINITVAAGELTNSGIPSIGAYTITCIKPTTVGMTTFDITTYCMGTNYNISLTISNPC